MESRSALAPVAVCACLLALTAGVVLLNSSEARSATAPDRKPLPDTEEPAQKISPQSPLKDVQSSEVLDAPLAPVAVGLAQRTITLLAVKTIAFSPNGKLVAVGGADGIARVWDFEKQTLWHDEQVHAGWLFDLQFHPDGKSLLTGGGDNAIKIWSFGKEWTARILQGHTDDLHGVAFTPDGKRVVSGSDDTTVRVWDLKTGKDQILGKHDKQVTDVAVHPEGHLAASSSRDGTIRLWDLDKLKPAGLLKGHTADVLAIAFSPDGRQIVSASYDKSVIVWDVGTKKAVHQFEKHTDWAFCVDFSTDGKKLATGGGDRKIFVWNLSDGKLLQEIEQQADVSAVEFSPDGKHFVAGLINGYLQLYRTGDKLEHFGVIPPMGWSPLLPGIVSEPLSTQEFLKLHADLQNPDSESWDASVGKLSVAGDGFTLQLLEAIDPATLSAPKREMWTRARETLTLRVQREAARDQIKWLEHRLNRSAAADLECHSLETVLKSWTLEKIGSQMQINGIRQELQRIRAEAPDKETKLTYGLLHERVNHYIDQLLEKYPEEKPKTEPVDPPKIEQKPETEENVDVEKKPILKR